MSPPRRVGDLRRLARRATLIYVLAAGSWVLLSDRLLATLVPGATALSWWQSAKGLAFVAATGIALYLLLARRERALAERESNLQGLIDASPLPIVVLDGAARVRLWNPAAVELFGWSAEEVLGRESPLVPEERREELRGLMERVLGGETLRGVEVRRHRRDGAPLDLSLAVAPLRDDAGEVVGAVGLFVDRTAEREREKGLRLHWAALEAVPNGILITDRDGTILWVNPAFTRLTGYLPEEVLGENPRILRSGRHDPSFYADLWDTILSGQVWHGQFLNRRKDGSLYIDEQTIAPVMGPRGEVTHFVGIKQDVSERREMEERLRRLAYHDPLTGLPNRLFLSERVAEALAVARRHGRIAALLLLDVQRFKLVNQSLGHEVGDRLLCELTVRLSHYVREGDIVCRFGADEFALFLDGIEAPGHAAQVAGRIRANLSQPVEIDGYRLHPELTIGLALFPQDGESFEEILQHAAAALSRAKATGAALQFYQAGLGERILERLTLEAEMRQAVSAGDLILHFQPVLDLVSGSVDLAEALLRWQHRERGLLGPESFLPVAHETGLILDLDRWVLAETADHLRRRPDSRLAVNLSSRSLDDPTLVKRVEEVITDVGVPGDRLCFEITESVAMRDPERSLGVLRQLKQLGVILALDDFGMGYSSLSYLKRFPVDLLKIDQSFVAGIGRDERDEQLIRMVLALAQSLGIGVLAEGVENEEQLTWLRETGCRYAQGYFVAPPRPG